MAATGRDGMHRNMLEKTSQRTYRRIVTCCYCCMFLDGWKVCQILHNQVQRSEFTQPRVLLNAANVMDAGIAAAYSLSTVWTMGRADRWTIAADGSNPCQWFGTGVIRVCYWYDSWLRILIHMTTCCRKAPQMPTTKLHSAIKIFIHSNHMTWYIEDHNYTITYQTWAMYTVEIFPVLNIIT